MTSPGVVGLQHKHVRQVRLGCGQVEGHSEVLWAVDEDVEVTGAPSHHLSEDLQADHGGTV